MNEETLPVTGYTPKHAKPASRTDAASSQALAATSNQALAAINAPSVGRHAAGRSAATSASAPIASAASTDAPSASAASGEVLPLQAA